MHHTHLTQVNRLKFYLAHGAALPLVSGMTPRIKASAAALATALQVRGLTSQEEGGRRVQR
jgi:hypothetical protein